MAVALHLGTICTFPDRHEEQCLDPVEIGGDLDVAFSEPVGDAAAQVTGEVGMAHSHDVSGLHAAIVALRPRVGHGPPDCAPAVRDAGRPVSDTPTGHRRLATAA